LRGIAWKQMSCCDTYRGGTPFVIMQLLSLATIGLFRWTATYLGDKLFRF
jgi:TRAP-type mannitol/chloroaromatic compound transport system permease large subunit